MHQDCSFCPVRDKGLCSAAAGEARDQLAALARPVRLAPGEALAFQGDAVTRWTAVRAGTIKFCRTTADGRQQVMGFALPGEVIGLTDGTHRATAEAATPVLACQFPSAAMERLIAEHPALSRHVLASACNDVARAQDQMLRLGTMSAMERIASLMLDLSARKGDDGGALPEGVTQVDLAACLGLTAETVSRSIAKLRSAGAVASGRRIAVRDAAALTELACA